MSIPRSKIPHQIKTNTQDLYLRKLEQAIGIKFKDPNLIKTAFIHRSYLNEHKNFKGQSNERLEFLGDAILSNIISLFLYRALPKSPEGKLTQIRASLVRTETLAKVALILNLGKYLYMSKGEEESGGRNNRSILADTFEALIGAIFLDSDQKMTERLIQKTILDNWLQLSKTAVSDNKSRLQEVLQRKYRMSPTYQLLTSWGPDHNRQFEIGVYLDNQILGKGTGKNKQTAAQAAAKNALEKVEAQSET